MPRPNHPPTPGSSSDIRGKEGVQAPSTFNLPPTAYQEVERTSTSSNTPSVNGSDSSYRPVSPASPADLSRKRPAPPSSPVVTKDDFSLPPPPTRSRKIIQMKPQSEQQDAIQSATASSAQTAARTQTTPQTPGKRKQNTAGTTAAGRKIARKTAHSLIERRRRSKMNEEFAVLKDMIPACKGQEMHKLAILQASIEYLRYLEQCVADLKAQKHSPPQPPMLIRQTAQDENDEDDDDEDEEMQDDEEEEQHSTAISTPATIPQDRPGSMVSLPSLSQITSTSTTSPSVFSSSAGRHFSISSASQASYSPYFHSNQASPAFGPQLSQISTAPGAMAAPQSASRETFGLGSPAIKPLDSSSQRHGNGRKLVEVASDPSGERRTMGKNGSGRSEQELDQEATAALLMLNNDRRNWKDVQGGEGGRSGTGMSVRDLLSG